jgi:uncharacterized membrane protein YkoI
MTRQEANKEILRRLEEIINKSPDLRFTQILWACGIEVYSSGKDIFHEEPQKTLKRITDSSLYGATLFNSKE